MTVGSRPQAVLFDLDGTLLDTAPDMVGAINALRVAENLPPLPFGELRPHVSHGAARLVEKGFGCRDGERFDELRQRFLDLYRGHLAQATTLFDGLDSVLSALETRRIPWGVVTNKPGWLTEPLLTELGLWRRAGCVVSGDTLPQRKPSPEPLLFAARCLGLESAGCVYVGDAERDVQAGRAAGMRTVVAAFGYIAADEDPYAWQADLIVHEPRELLTLFGLAAGD